MPLPSIKLMPDYDCWPVWYHCGDAVGEVPPAVLQLSPALTADLWAWAAVYDAHLNRADPAATTWTPSEEDEFYRDGRALAVRLAREVRERFNVFVFDGKSRECQPIDDPAAH